MNKHRHAESGNSNIYTALKTRKVLISMFLVGVISFPTFYFVKEWLLKQKKIHNEERRKIIKELRMKQQKEYEDMLRREKEVPSTS